MLYYKNYEANFKAPLILYFLRLKNIQVDPEKQEDAAQLVPRQIQYWNVLEKRRKTRQTSAQKESSRHGIKECASKGRVR